MAHGEGVDFDIPFEKRLLSLKNLKSTFIIRKILKAQGFNAIILNTNLAAFLVRLALPKRLKKTTKVVNFVHGYLFSREIGALRRILFLFCEMLVRKKCDVVITMNSHDFEAAKRYRLASGRVIASRGVGIRDRRAVRSPEKLRREFFDDGCRVITFVGELSGRKNQAFIIKNLPDIRARLGDVRLCLVGEGDERSRLTGLARRLKIEDAVVFVGYRENAMDFIRACDLYVSSALIEGMPLNVIEAMSLGKTVLISRIKGHRDLVSDGVNGYLYDLDNREEFVTKACLILSGGIIDPRRVSDSVAECRRDVAVKQLLGILVEEIPDL